MTSNKTSAINKAISKNSYQLIGYAADETNRIHQLTGNKYSVLLELGIAEKDTFDICRKYHLLSPLYDLGVSRDGCWFCPNANKRQRDLIKTEYPNLFEKIKDLVKMCNYDITQIRGRNTWLNDIFEEDNSLGK